MRLLNFIRWQKQLWPHEHNIKTRTTLFLFNGIVICLRFVNTKMKNWLIFIPIALRYVAISSQNIKLNFVFLLLSLLLLFHLITFFWWVHGCARNHDTNKQTKIHTGKIQNRFFYYCSKYRNIRIEKQN